MNNDMASGFQAGAGVDPSLVKTLILAVSTSAVALIFAWVALQVFVAYQEDLLEPGEALFAIARVAIVLLTLLSFLYFL